MLLGFDPTTTVPESQQCTPPHQADRANANYLAYIAHFATAMLLVLSIWIETAWWLRAGLAMRGTIVLTVFLYLAKIWKWPSIPGWHRKLVWLSAWMIPLGYFVASLFPETKKVGLHFVFIGGFALMAFSVGLHVVLVYGKTQKPARVRSWKVAMFGACFLLAIVFRAMVEFDRPHFFFWLGGSASVFLVGTLFWAWLVFPLLWGEIVFNKHKHHV